MPLISGLPRSRRSVLGMLAGSLAAAVWAQGRLPMEVVSHLAIGNYGMKSLPVEDAIGHVAKIGFGGFELCAIAGWNSAPEQLGTERRRAVAAQLREQQLRLVAIMEDLPPQAENSRHLAGLERLREAMVIGRDLVPNQRPMVQTVLGGGTWDEVKTLFRDRVGDWAKLAEELDAIVCIKPHRFGAMSTPEQAAWIIEQLGSTTRVRMVYDYSHYAFRDLNIEATIAQAGSHVAYVAMKDARQNGEQVSFALPGQAGTIDHATIRRGLLAAGYPGDFCCEVSGQVSSQSGYDPVAAAKVCYQNMKPMFTA